MTETQTYKMRCKCGYESHLPASASDKCPRCQHRLQLAPKESRSIMRDAINNTLAPKPAQSRVTTRSITDKDAPKDEGEWEFQLKDGVLTILAWNDEKTEAQCVRLCRRGMQIHLMRTAESGSEE
jgi:hypothetical protein